LNSTSLVEIKMLLELALLCAMH